jgi:ELWxxDGT repeat protein
VGGTLFFVANDGLTGLELWKSDGSEAGTVLVKDINPNSSYGYPVGSRPYELTAVGGTLFFTADDGVHGQELWKSDGTEAGTVLVKDINPDTNPFGPRPNGLAAVGGTLFFAANDGEHGTELWKSDGTEAGTVLVKDINPNSAYGYAVGSYPHYLTDVGGTLFFAANDGTNSLELWKSDGTEAGTVLVKDINPGGGNNGSGPKDLTAVNGTLYFSAFVPDTGIELWKSDGTADGTVLVADINPGRAFSSPHALAFVNGALYFAANDGRNGIEPWILRPDPPPGLRAAGDFISAPALDRDWLNKLNGIDIVPP